MGQRRRQRQSAAGDGVQRSGIPHPESAGVFRTGAWRMVGQELAAIEVGVFRRLCTELCPALLPGPVSDNLVPELAGDLW